MTGGGLRKPEKPGFTKVFAGDEDWGATIQFGELWAVVVKAT